MKKIKIYLAGKMGGLTLAAMNKWRIDAKHLLVAEADKSDCVVEVVNPVVFYNFEEKRHQTEIEVEEFDLAQLSDLDIINLDLPRKVRYKKRKRNETPIPKDTKGPLPSIQC